MIKIDFYKFSNRFKNLIPLVLIATFLIGGFFPVAVLSAINQQINYQGKLTDSGGDAVANGSYSIVFSLYTVSSGGSNIWTETQSVTVTDGLFSVMLGSITSLATVDFNQTLYLGVNINADGEMSPRKIIGAVPSAFTADKLDNLDSTDFISTTTYALPNVGSIGSSTATTTALGNFGVTGFLDVGASYGYMQGGYTILKYSSVNASLAVGGTGGLDDTANTSVGIGALSSNNGGQLNTAIGRSSLNSNTTGIQNTSIGANALFSNIDGIDNSIIGAYALFRNITGNYNTALGFEASRNNASATGTVAIGYQAARGPLLAYSNQNGVYVGYQAGYSAETGSNDNTFVGYQAGYSNTTAISNTGLGANALYSNVDGIYNVAVGENSLYSNTSGTLNAAVGRSSMFSNTTGVRNSALGNAAGYFNTTGSDGVFVGHNSGVNNTSATSSIFIGSGAGQGIGGAYSNQGGVYIGYQAGYGAQTGSDYNTFVGHQSGRSNTTGSQNVALGGSSLYSNTTGGFNTALGYVSMNTNTTGEYNTAIGHNTLTDNKTGSYNVALGTQALQNNTSATNTVAIGYLAAVGSGDYSSQNGVYLGYGAGALVETGSNNNIFLGYQAGNNVTTGATNLILGYDIDAPSATASNQLSIGNLIFGTGIDGTGTTISSGNIGIATTTPWAKLSVVPTAGSPSFIVASSTASTRPDMFIDSFGRVHFGEHTSSLDLSGTPIGSVFNIARDQPAGLGVFQEYPIFSTQRAGAGPASAWFNFSSRGTIASKSSVADTDALLLLGGLGYDGDSYELGGSIGFQVDGTPSDGIMPTFFTVSTNDDVGGGVAERLRIDSAGRVGINTVGSSLDSTTILTVNGTTTDAFGFGLKVRDSNDANILVVRNDGRVGVGTSTPQYKLAVDGTVGFQGTDWATTTIGQFDAYFKFQPFNYSGFQIPEIVPQSNIFGGVSGIWQNSLYIREVDGSAASLGWVSADFGTYGATASLDVTDGSLDFTTATSYSFDGAMYLSGLTTDTGASTASLCLSSGGEVVQNTDNETCLTSSLRFKHNVNDLSETLDATEVLNQFRPVRYEYNEVPGERFGLIAEEVELIDPRLVAYDTEGRVNSVRYISIIPILIQTIQDIWAKLTLHDDRLQELEDRINELEQSQGVTYTSSSGGSSSGSSGGGGGSSDPAPTSDSDPEPIVEEPAPDPVSEPEPAPTEDPAPDPIVDPVVDPEPIVEEPAPDPAPVVESPAPDPEPAPEPPSDPAPAQDPAPPSDPAV